MTGVITQTERQSRRRASAGATVADVARLAGVSAMSVSRVVNCDPGVTDATREKVQAAIAALGYVPNPAARSLAGARQLRIALLHANPSAAYLSEFLIGSLGAATASNAMLVVEQYDPPESAPHLAARLRKHRVHAVLLPPPLCDDAAVIAALSAEGLTLARIATGAPDLGGHAVTIDDRAAAHAMATHLVAQGHRRIGFITGNPNQTASALRLEGFTAALEQAGVAPDPALIAAGDFTYRSGLAAAETLLALPHRPTAIFASNDDMAAAAVAAAHRLGLDVPRDLSVTGFDDTAMATATWPELTTIRQPVAAMSQAAVRLLVESGRPGAGTQARQQRLEFELIQRGSDGPAPAN
ncbi:LacI family DNA-binding transcriptional regulator [Novosphingobium sp. SL115]|uniref:LacI family DNA-binding transcriptional regulator n=1 Tax=Novosphingobium sp. SL115 TaxID=2995150 RepID=UPI00227684CD|nr:LacI family DNA-binding transcriptional regulator [Novosphingobium sp. SL115]MCY1670760.1 LacI family DNA-binding transcriptional regulator [Novosphingobium sp. SL115]